MTVLNQSKKNKTAEEFYQGESGKRYYEEKFNEGMTIGREFQLRYFQPHCDENLDLLDFGCSNGLSLRNAKTQLV